MKAVITEIRGSAAIILSDDGCITKVKNNNYVLGQEVSINMKVKFKSKKALAFACAAALFVMLLGIGATAAYYTPYTYVSLDVNPSIEYDVNVFDRVISATGVNDDGTEIIDGIDLSNLENKPIDEAVATTVDQIASEGYFDSGEAGIEITTSGGSTEKSEELAQELQQTAEDKCDENEVEVTVEAEAVGKERVAEAKELGTTPGKLNLVEKMIASSSDPESFDKSEWLNKSVKDIMAQTKQNKKADKDNQINSGDPDETDSEDANEADSGDTDEIDSQDTDDVNSDDSGAVNSGNTDKNKDKNKDKDKDKGNNTNDDKADVDDIDSADVVDNDDNTVIDDNDDDKADENDDKADADEDDKEDSDSTDTQVNSSKTDKGNNGKDKDKNIKTNGK